MSTKKTKLKETEQNVETKYLKILLLLLLAVAVRFVLVSTKYQNIIANHVEISTPVSSWKRVQEGLYLQSKNINPYKGDVLHETPTSLLFYKAAMELFTDVRFMFIFFDICSGLILYAASKKYMKHLQKEHSDKTQLAKDVQEYLPSEKEYDSAPLYVLLAVLFNPLTFLGCVGYSTLTIHNFFLSIFLYGMISGNIFLSAIALAICASVSLYPIILIMPLYIYFAKVHKEILKGILTVIIFIVSLGFINGFNSSWGTDLSYINSVYGCILAVPDLQPNIGLFWYFFTEMFDHFRDLFTYSFQINATVLYSIPLLFKFRKDPFLLTVALLILIAIFKSYPCVSDLGFALNLLPNFMYLFSFLQNAFPVGVIFIITSCLAPIVWYLWIYCNSANANFYFGVTLAFAIAEIFLLTDLLFAQIKRDYTIKNGKERKINGSEAALYLE